MLLIYRLNWVIYGNDTNKENKSNNSQKRWKANYQHNYSKEQMPWVNKLYNNKLINKRKYRIKNNSKLTVHNQTCNLKNKDHWIEWEH